MELQAILLPQHLYSKPFVFSGLPDTEIYLSCDFFPPVGCSVALPDTLPAVGGQQLHVFGEVIGGADKLPGFLWSDATALKFGGV